MNIFELIWEVLRSIVETFFGQVSMLACGDKKL